MSAPEKAPLEKAKEGDIHALTTLLERVQPQLYRFSLRMCRHKEDAEDVLQESMLALSNSVSEFRGTSTVSTWLFTVARRFCMKKRGKSARTPGAVEHTDLLQEERLSREVQRGENPEVNAQERELSRELEGAIRSLDPKYREVFLLRDGEGLTAKEVAEVLGISVAAVKSRLHRARGDLRTALRGNSGALERGCPDMVQMLSQYLEGELTSDVCSQMEEHVEACSPCKDDCDDLKGLLRVCKESSCEVPLHVQLNVKASLKKALAQVKNSESRRERI